ncbi:trypsin-like serine peptidase [Macrococcus capreoli]|uniref:trypsin-like serine peptidase n=1 Tax=Macrococcus capreoli TaxID=2982690 RepID=UPI003EE76FE2
MKKINIIISLLLISIVYNTNQAYGYKGTISNFDNLENQNFPDKQVIIPPKKPTRQAQPGILSKESLIYKHLNIYSPTDNSIDFNTVNNIGLDRSVIDTDDRSVVTDINKAPFNQIVKLVCTYPSGNSYDGTGVIVSRDSVLTAAHNLYKNDEKNTFATKCEVAAGLTSKTTYNKAISTGTKFLIPEKWISPLIQYDSDIGMIKLDKPIGEITGTMGITHLIYPNQSIETAGYPQFLKNNTMYYSKGNVKSSTPVKFYHDLDTWSGQSGSPIWGSGNLLIGLHTAGVNEEKQENPLDNQYNKAVRITERNYDYILYWMNALPGRVYGNSKEQISISTSGQKIWSNLQLSLEKTNTNNLIGKVYYAKYYYDLPDGNRYISLYTKDDSLLGYINEKYTINIKPNSYSKEITITKAGYNIFEDTFFNSKKSMSDSYIGKKYLAKEIYTLGDGRKYYSLYDNNNKLFGYMNVNATI